MRSLEKLIDEKKMEIETYRKILKKLEVRSLDFSRDVISQINFDYLMSLVPLLKYIDISKEEKNLISDHLNCYDKLCELKVLLAEMKVLNESNLENEVKLVEDYNKDLIYYLKTISTGLDKKRKEFTKMIRENEDTIAIIEKIIDLLKEDEINFDRIYKLVELLPLEQSRKLMICREIYTQVTKEKEVKKIEEPKETKEPESTASDSILTLADRDKELVKLIGRLKKVNTELLGILKGNKELIANQEELVNISKEIDPLIQELNFYLHSLGNNDQPFLDYCYEELLKIYTEINTKYNAIYQVYLRNKQQIKVESKVENNDNNPIIFIMCNEDIMNSFKEIDEVFEDFDNYPEDNFYQKDLLPALELLRSQSSFVDIKNAGFDHNVITHAKAASYKEIKMRSGSGGTARIYYDYVKSKSGRISPVVFYVCNKTESFDLTSYTIIERFLASNFYKKVLPEYLDSEDYIDQCRILEEYVFSKTKERIEKKGKKD